MHVIKTKKSPRKKLLVLAVALLFLAVAAGIFAYTQNLGPFSKAETEPTGQEIDYNEPTEEQVEAGEQVKEETVKDTTKPGDTTSGSEAPTSSGKEVAVGITNRNRSGSTLTVKTQIQEVSSSGTCTLTLTKAGQKTITQTARTQALPSSSTCQGFTVKNLASGEWTLKIDYKSDKSYGSVTEKV